MIYNPNYQLFVAEKDLVNDGVSGLRNLGINEIAIIDEDDSTHAITTWTNVKRFSLYQKCKNDRGKTVIIKHSGPKPILTDHIRTKTFEPYVASVGQYWQLVIPTTFGTCCQDYTIEFNIQNEQIMKSQFPNYLMQEVSVSKGCCESMCSGDTNPFSTYELAFALWRETALNSQGYLRAYLAFSDDGVMSQVFTTYDDFGNAIISYTYNDGSDHEVIATLDSYEDGKINYTEDGTHATATIQEFFEKIAEDYGHVDGNDDPVPTDIAIVFEVAPEDLYSSRNINLKYDNLRNSTASVALKGGFKCSTDIELKNNMESENGIYIDSGLVGKFAYPIGEGYDVMNMEQYDSRRTLNSPYPFSDYTFSENGINFRSKEDKQYNLLTIGYQQQSDTLIGGLDYPFGTTIAIDNANSDALIDSTGGGTAWYNFITGTLGLSI